MRIARSLAIADAEHQVNANKAMQPYDILSDMFIQLLGILGMINGLKTVLLP